MTHIVPTPADGKNPSCPCPELHLEHPVGPSSVTGHFGSLALSAGPLPIPFVSLCGFVTRLPFIIFPYAVEHSLAGDFNAADALTVHVPLLFFSHYNTNLIIVSVSIQLDTEEIPPVHKTFLCVQLLSHPQHKTLTKPFPHWYHSRGLGTLSERALSVSFSLRAIEDLGNSSMDVGSDSPHSRYSI